MLNNEQSSNFFWPPCRTVNGIRSRLSNRSVLSGWTIFCLYLFSSSLLPSDVRGRMHLPAGGGVDGGVYKHCRPACIIDANAKGEKIRMEHNAPQDEWAHQVFIDCEESQEKHLMTRCTYENIWRNDEYCIDTAHTGKYKSIKYLCIWCALIIQSGKVRYTFFGTKYKGKRPSVSTRGFLARHGFTALSCANSRWRSLEAIHMDFFGSSWAAVSMMIWAGGGP